MTTRQRAFAEHFARIGNATQAAVSAGYSPESAYSQGSRLLKNAEIREYLLSFQVSGSEERIADVAEVRSFWTRVLSDPTARMQDRLRASELLARSYGVFAGGGDTDVLDANATVENQDEPTIIVLPYNGRDDGQKNIFEVGGNKIEVIV